MSELKVIDLGNIRESIEKGESVYYEYYPKSEADKVIAEKDKELRRHKYKRCLAMAYSEWLKQMILRSYSESILYRRAVTRERKWKELAEKFKEAK